MKHYVKPTVEIYMLSGNETICGGCDIKIKDNASLGATLDFLGGNDDGTLTKEESKNIFGPGESCEREIINYCKFTSVGTSNVSWS